MRCRPEHSELRRVPWVGPDMGAMVHASMSMSVSSAGSFRRTDVQASIRAHPPSAKRTSRGTGDSYEGRPILAGTVSLDQAWTRALPSSSRRLDPNTSRSRSNRHRGVSYARPAAVCHCFQAVGFGNDAGKEHCSRAVAHRQCHPPSRYGAVDPSPPKDRTDKT